MREPTLREADAGTGVASMVPCREIDKEETAAVDGLECTAGFSRSLPRAVIGREANNTGSNPIGLIWFLLFLAARETQGKPRGNPSNFYDLRCTAAATTSMTTSTHVGFRG